MNKSPMAVLEKMVGQVSPGDDRCAHEATGAIHVSVQAGLISAEEARDLQRRVLTRQNREPKP